MGTTKSDQYTVEEIKLAAIAKALGHPARIAIIKAVIQQKSCICGTLVEQLPLSQSTVSQHLKALKDAQILQGEVEGVKTCYCIDPETWKLAEDLFKQLFASYEPQENSCC